MKKINSLLKGKNKKVVCIAALLVVTIAVSIVACNKKSDVNNQQYQNDNAQFLKQIQDNLAKKGLVMTTPVNEKVTTFYADAKGNAIAASILKLHRVSTFGISSACDYSNSPSANILSYSVSSMCSTYAAKCSTSTASCPVQSYALQVSWTYQVSTNNNIVAVNPTIPALTTKGSLLIYSSTGTKISTVTATTVNIVDNGLDVSNPGNELFTVTFTTPWLNPATTPYGQAGNVEKVGGTFATNCPDGESFAIATAPYTPYTTASNLAANPCLRNDPINYSTTNNPSYITIYGEDPTISVCPWSGFSLPSLQQVQYSTNNGKTWLDGTINGLTVVSTNSVFKNFIPALTTGGLLYNGSYVDPNGACQMRLTLPTKTTYTILLRERNLTFNTVTSPYPIPTASNCCVGSWITYPAFTYVH
jgi:hypothetical protein